MKIIHTVESYLPDRHGMSEVVRQISENLVRLGHEVIVCTSFNKSRILKNINGVQVKEFKLKGNYVNGIFGERNSYLNFLLTEKYDVIANFAAQQWATDLCLEILDQIDAVKIFIPTGFSAIRDNSYSLYYNKMKIWMKKYNLNIFLSKSYRDYTFALENNINNIHIIPNGASFEEFNREIKFDIRRHLNLDKEAQIILHVGNYTGLKGHDEALEIFRKSIYKNSHLLFIGQNFDDKTAFNLKLHYNWLSQIFNYRLYHPRNIFKILKFSFQTKKNRIHFLKLDREILIDVYKSSDILLFPSNIECSPLVFFEAIASKNVVLITNVGNSNELIFETRGGVILPTYVDQYGFSHADIGKSANILDSILTSKKLKMEYSESGYKSWLKNFTWEKLTLQYDEIYQKLFSEKEHN